MLFNWSVLLLLISPVVAHAQGSHSGAKPNQICSAILEGVRQYKGWGSKTNDMMANTVSDLRGFRLGLNATSNVAHAKSLNLSSNTVSSKSLEALNGELLGIEKLWYAPKGESGEEEPVLAIVKLEGEAEINEFYEDIAQFSNTVNAIANPVYARAGKFKKFPFTAIGAVFTGANLYLGHYDYASLGALQLLTVEPLSYLQYYFKKRGAFGSVAEKTKSFLETKAPNEWIFDSWSYEPTSAVATNVWQNGIVSQKARDAIVLQDLLDTQGPLSRATLPLFLKYKHKLPEDVIQERLKEQAKVWTGFDQLIQFDEQGTPTMWFVMRTLVKRPSFPKPITSPESKSVVKELVPVTVPARSR